MNSRLNLGRGAAILACAAALAGSGGALTPGAAAAAEAHGCGARTIAIPQKSGKALQVPVSRIRVEGGATCQEAVAVIRGELIKKPVSGWAYGRGAFQVPHGLTPRIATNGHKKVKWATIGS